MKIINIHKRVIDQPQKVLADLLSTLSTDNDKIWPKDKWPAMKFKNGLTIGEKGGHGPIRYIVKRNDPKELMEFEFTEPKGIKGIHKLELTRIDSSKTELKHTISAQTKGLATLKWLFVIRSLHNALMKDTFDKVENQFSGHKKRTKWSFWVKFLRAMFK